MIKNRKLIYSLSLFVHIDCSVDYDIPAVYATQLKFLIDYSNNKPFVVN